MTFRLRGLILFSLFFGASAHATELDFKTESFATYIRGEYASCFLSDYAFSNGGGTTAKPTTTDAKVNHAVGGEFGLIFAGQRVNLRIAGQYLAPTVQQDVEGYYGGSKQFDLNSKVSAFIVSGNLELLLYRTTKSHVILGGGGGVGFVSLDNAYTLTSAGKTTYPTMSNYTEHASGQAPMIQAYAGYETWFTDRVTAVIDAGYRYMPVTNIQSTQSTTAFTGNESNGSALKNLDGSDRTLNLGGVFGGFSFRFYL